MSATPDAPVRVTQHFDAAPERVFDAFVDAGKIGDWMFGPAVRDEELLHVRIDPRVGGQFSFLVRRNGQEIDHTGTYLEISRPARLGFTWAVAGEPQEPARVSVEIAPADGGCDLTLTHAIKPEWAQFAKTVEGSWLLMLSTLHAALH